MKTLKLTGKVDPDGHLKLDIPTPYRAVDVEVVVVIESKTEKSKRYDFSEISGKLSWKGDVLKTQKALRDEWE